jgi:hypothetical protein
MRTTNWKRDSDLDGMETASNRPLIGYR